MKIISGRLKNIWLKSRMKVRSRPIDFDLLRQESRRLIKSESQQLGLPRSLGIVVPCYGHAQYLGASLESVLAQNRLPDEVVAVVDASPDQSESLLNGFAERFRDLGVDFVVLRNRRNRGQAFSLNRGVKTIRSDLVMILNDDDLLFPDSLELTFDYFSEGRGFALLGASCIPFSDGTVAQRDRTAIKVRSALSENLVVHPKSAVLSYASMEDFNVTHSGMTFYRSAWVTVGGYQPKKWKRVVDYSDRDFQFRMNCAYPIAAVKDEQPLSLWRKGSSVDKGLNS